MIPAVAPAGDGFQTGQPPGRVPLVGQLVHVQSHHWLVTQVTPLHYPEVGRASPLPVPMMLEQSRAHGMPPLNAIDHARDPAWRTVLRTLLGDLEKKN